MSFKSHIVPRMAERLLGKERLEKKRAKFERARMHEGKPHAVEFFHDPADPYSQILAKVMPEFQRKYDIQLVTHRVGLPADSAVPEREKRLEYSKLDAARLARKAGLDFEYKNAPADVQTFEADKRLQDLGHYFGGTIYYGGEWYWGLDRLHYLEARLTELNARNPGSLGYIYAPPIIPPFDSSARPRNTGAELHWYLSFRSPYTAIVRHRVEALARAYGAKLTLRFVLPMVMRGLPVPPAKKTYIPFDTAREARRLGVEFGRVLDPVGRPVEMGYSLLPWARDQGKDYDYAQNWLTAVWAQGVDVGSLKGLRKVVERSGLNWAEAKDIVGNEDWREEAEVNRLDMMNRGIWGVPSFRVGDTITWGQDRLWVIEDALKHFPEI